MKLALLGYGKMGRAVEAAACERGHTVGVTIDDEDDWMAKLDDVKGCDSWRAWCTTASSAGALFLWRRISVSA